MFEDLSVNAQKSKEHIWKELLSVCSQKNNNKLTHQGKTKQKKTYTEKK